MKNTFRKILSVALALAMTFCFAAGVHAADAVGGVIVLYTNDVHCGIDGYSTLATYRAELIADGYTVVTVDAGDAIQGEAIGSLTSGSAIIDLMNTVGYDYAVPGNHEFDYGMDNYLNLAENEADFEYLSANFIDLTTGATVFDAYEMVDTGSEQIAFVGIATPETYTKSTPVYFQDENGNYIYSFGEDAFYSHIQSAVDAAIDDGADRVVAVGHLGIDGTTEGWRSTDVIANTTGIDAFLDAHAHQVIPQATYTNKDGEPVVLSSTGTKLANFGQLTLSPDGSETTELITPDSVDLTALSEEGKAAYDAVQDKIDAYTEELSYLYEVLGESEVELSLNDPDGNWVVRTKETSMGDFVADAYRTVTGADIALVNAGGVRASIPAGEVTRKSLMDVNPWNNEMCVIEATGRQILDALEHGARLSPESCGGFLQVSGLNYTIHNYRETPVVTDEMGNFAEVDSAKARRVANVTIGGQAIDPDKTYTVAGSYYTLKNGGDGFTMFADCKVVQRDGLPTDAEMLIRYFTETLGGRVTAAQYGNVLGDGRITVYGNASEVPAAPEADQPQTSTQPTGKNPGTGDRILFPTVTLLAAAAIVTVTKRRSR